MPELHHRACHLCEAICGIVIETEGDRIVSIRGDKADPLSRGHICPKAVALQDLHADPDRIRRPMRRVGERWEEISTVMGPTFRETRPPNALVEVAGLVDEAALIEIEADAWVGESGSSS